MSTRSFGRPHVKRAPRSLVRHIGMRSTSRAKTRLPRPATGTVHRHAGDMPTCLELLASPPPLDSGWTDERIQKESAFNFLSVTKQCRLCCGLRRDEERESSFLWPKVKSFDVLVGSSARMSRPDPSDEAGLKAGRPSIGN